jgi:hypothetical protein
MSPRSVSSRGECSSCQCRCWGTRSVDGVLDAREGAPGGQARAVDAVADGRPAATRRAAGRAWRRHRPAQRANVQRAAACGHSPLAPVCPDGPARWWRVRLVASGIGANVNVGSEPDNSLRARTMMPLTSVRPE